MNDFGSRRRRWAPGLLVCIAAASSPVSAQDSGGGSVRLDEVTVTSTRLETPRSRVPAAIGTVGADEVQLARQQIGLDESLARMPGLFMQNRHNFAQDLRIAIRGSGARANFGIRGIRIYADGIPATLPDGQAGVDDIDLGSVERVEVIRGPASSLYGPASGGVINLYTEDGPPTPFVEARLAAGEYGYFNPRLKAGGQQDRLNYLVSLSHLELDGYRDHARVESHLANAKLRFDIDADSELTAVVNVVDSPVADDPGGLTAAEVAADRTQARSTNRLFDAGESVTQQKVGLSYRRRFGGHHEVKLRNYYTWRDFRNALPFAGGVANSNGGAVDLKRFFWGGGGDYTYDGQALGRDNRLIVGVDVDIQDDDRRRFVNNRGVPGALTFDQREKVTSYGVYLRDEFELTTQIGLSAGIRYDRVSFDVDDRFLANNSGDDSGSIAFSEWSPMVGARWSPHEAVNVYANVSSGFETPTTTELANPDGGGFNPALRAQTALSYELGVKGVLPGRLSYEAAVYHIDVDDELIAFELASQPGRSFFENAARSTRDGLELGLDYQPPWLDGLTLSAAYTYSDFRFDRFRARDGGVFDGNRVPGIPEHLVHGQATYFHASGFHAAADLLLVGSFFADNANSVQNESYQVANLRVGYLGEFESWEYGPFVGINNLFDEKYNDGIRLNAFGGRFFEPAPERNVYAGITLRYNFD